MDIWSKNNSVVIAGCNVAVNNSTLYNTTSTSAGCKQYPPVKYISLLLLMLVIFTVVGNCLVVIAIGRYKELRTVTNQMILSLATADLLIGLVVMPFNISNDILQYWPYGQVMCDLWHSFDVLASTASILNLCIISLDRYWAVTDPIAYPRLMSQKRGLICIAFVWLCSAAISFPTIVWWHAVDRIIPDECNFTQDSVYLLLSSMISFYIPVFVMIVVYIKIFLVIKNQSKQHLFTLRAHRGGETVNGQASDKSGLSEALFADADMLTASGDNRNSEGDSSYLVSADSSFKSTSKPAVSNADPVNLKRLVEKVNPTKSKKPVNNITNEYRVARTLGLVLGVFLLFWLPFFLCNLLYAMCKDCIKSDMIFLVVTWLGHANSGVNPVIYALSMKNMRRAFISIVTCQCNNYYKYRKSRRRKIAIGMKNCHSHVLDS